MPKRIQRKRAKGWRMPAGAVYVGRPTVFGNPFNGNNAVDDYKLWLSPYGESLFPSLVIKRRRLLEALPQLCGKDLACWCALDEPCHADVLLAMANEDKR